MAPRRPPMCRRARLRLVPLEDRRVPAAIVVNIAGEDPNPGHGAVSFRDALAVANSNNQPDTITFAPGITTVSITDFDSLTVSEAGQANETVIDGGGVVTLQRAGNGTVLYLGPLPLLLSGPVYVQLRGLTISGGYATQSDSVGFHGGGGLFVQPGANASLDRVIVSDNIAARISNDHGNGGGILNAGALHMTDCSVTDNAAGGSGGGIFNFGQLLIENSTIADNESSIDGGGIYNGSAGGGLVAVNCTVSGNTGFLNGGGIYANSATTLTNLTITNNHTRDAIPEGGTGGGLFVAADPSFTATVTANNTIIAGNSEILATLPDNLAGPLTAASGHNLIGGNALLGPLADNGGPTRTHVPLAGSPAINRGDNTLAVDNGAPLATDQRGALRVFGGTVDIGAYEVQQVLPPPPIFVVAGSGPGGPPRVNVFSPQGALLHSFLAFGAGFTGGVRVATGDVNDDGVPDVVTAAGPGGGPHVQVFDGTKLGMVQADGQLAPAAVLASFFAYGGGFGGGVYVAAGDVNGDGHADIVTGAGPGGGPHVRVIDGATGQEWRSFFAFDVGFTGGVTVAAGDVDADGQADVVVGAGPGGGPHVKVFSGRTADEVRSFFAFDRGFTGGVFVAAGRVADLMTVATLGQPAAGDANADIFVGAGAGGGPHVKIFSGATGVEYQSFYAYGGGFGGGVRVAADDLDGDGLSEFVTGAGPGGGPHVREYLSASQAEVRSFFAFDPGFLGGVFVG